MSRLIAVALASVLGAGCASESGAVTVQPEAACCLDRSGDVLGASGCAGASVTADVDGNATLTLAWCGSTGCGRKCAGLEDSTIGYAACMRECHYSRTRVP